MNVTYFYTALIIGLALSLLLEEFAGITAGGMIVPGYMAMICDDLLQVALIFAVAILVYVIVNFLLPKFVILFGKRKFVVTIIISVVIKLTLELLFPAVFPMSSVAFRGIGVITPALIANCMAKQGFRYTIPATLGVSYATFGLLTLLYWIF